MPPKEYRYCKSPVVTKSWQDIADAACGWSYQESVTEPDSMKETACRYAIAALAWVMNLTGHDDPFPEAAGIAEDFDEARDFGRHLRNLINDSAKDN